MQHLILWGFLELIVSYAHVMRFLAFCMLSGFSILTSNCYNYSVDQYTKSKKVYVLAPPLMSAVSFPCFKSLSTEILVFLPAGGVIVEQTTHLQASEAPGFCDR